MSPIVVYGSAPAWGNPDFSPFVTKLETWLRFSGLPYVRGRRGNPLKAPKGKIPYVELDGKLVGDSQHIIEELTRRHGVTLEDGLTPEQTAVGRAVRRMLEEGLYFITLRMRWLEEDGWAAQYPAFKKMFPPLVGAVAVPLVRRSTRAKAQAQGVGRHTRAEVVAMAIADLAAVETILGNKPYLLGDTPRSVDATVYAFLIGIQAHPVDSPIRVAARSPPFLAYSAAIREKYWPATDLMRTGG